MTTIPIDLQSADRAVLAAERALADARATLARLRGQLDADASLTTFAHAVLAAARRITISDGYGASNLRDKAIVQYVWQEYAEWSADRMTFAEFKRRLAIVNGRGLVLAHEDLIPEGRRAEFARAEVRVGQSVYHWVRI